MKEQKEDIFEFILTTKFCDRTISVFHQYYNDGDDNFHMAEHLILLIQSVMISEGYSKERLKEELSLAIENFI